MARFPMLVLTAMLTIAASAVPQGPPASPRPVLVQGAMQLETALLVSRLEDVEVEKVGAWTFWRGTLGGYPIIVSKTLKGVSNAAAATAEGSAGNDANEHRLAGFHADSALLAAARSVKQVYARGRVVEGVIGSSDIWNEEIDRIARLRGEYGTSVEENGLCRELEALTYPASA